jgi:uncharacterized membrane protein
MARQRPRRPRLEGTGRLEAFSDGVLAIVVTLLVFELRLPETLPPDPTSRQLLDALGDIAPKILVFALSFFTVAIFWVNHHHFFHRVTPSDWKVLWINNLLLFWLAGVPFTTSLIGDFPQEPVAIAVYSLDLAMAGLSFSLLAHYVFFEGKLGDDSASEEDRHREWRRSVLGTGMYFAAAPLGFVWPPAALAIVVMVPLFYVVPRLLSEDAGPI